MRGELRLILDGQSYELREGDAACFDARILHDYESLNPVLEDESPPLILWLIVEI